MGRGGAKDGLDTSSDKHRCAQVKRAVAPPSARCTKGVDDREGRRRRKRIGKNQGGKEKEEFTLNAVFHLLAYLQSALVAILCIAKRDIKSMRHVWHRYCYQTDQQMDSEQNHFFLSSSFFPSSTTTKSKIDTFT